MKTIVLSLLTLALASAAFADEYTPVDWIKVIEGGGIEVKVNNARYGAAPGAGCIFGSGSINGVSVPNKTKWQMRGEDSEWVDVDGTELDNGLCGNLLPHMPGEFRWVAEIGIDGKIGKYASGNILIVSQEGEVTSRPAEEPAEEPETTAVEAVTWGFLKSRAAP